MEKNLEELIEKADRGRKFWMSLNVKEQEYVLLLPEQDTKLNQICREAFGELLRQEKAEGRVLAVFESKQNAEKSISGQEAEELLQFYSMYCFTDKLIIGSLDKPYGRKIGNLLLLEHMDLKKAVRAVLFGIVSSDV